RRLFSSPSCYFHLCLRCHWKSREKSLKRILRDEEKVADGSVLRAIPEQIIALGHLRALDGDPLVGGAHPEDVARSALERELVASAKRLDHVGWRRELPLAEALTETLREARDRRAADLEAGDLPVRGLETDVTPDRHAGP